MLYEWLFQTASFPGRGEDFLVNAVIESEKVNQ